MERNLDGLRQPARGKRPSQERRLGAGWPGWGGGSARALISLLLGPPSHPHPIPSPWHLAAIIGEQIAAPSPSPGSRHSWGPATSAASAQSTAGCAQSRAPQNTKLGRGPRRAQTPETDALTLLPTDTDSSRRSYAHHHTRSLVCRDRRTDKHAITVPRLPPPPLPPPSLPSLQAPLRRLGHL